MDRKKLPDTLITTYLKLTKDQFKPAFIADDNMRIEKLENPDVRYYRFMYFSVGEQWNWTDRLSLSDDEIRKVLNDEAQTMFVMYYNGSPAGYVELQKLEQSTEVMYCGLREPFIGIGLGKHLLSYGVQQAFRQGAECITVSTCNLDGPHSLENYVKRGFQPLYTTERPMPDKEYIMLTAKQRGIY